MTATREGILFVVSSPSGAGKGTILERVLAADERLGYSVSATTRPPRPGEIDGEDYVFLDAATFERRVEEGAFVEWAEVHGYHYGTLHESLEIARKAGEDVVLELDVQGMRHVRAAWPDVVTVFVMAPSIEELERRIRRRGTDDEASIATRLETARKEIPARFEYDYIVMNHVLDDAVADVQAIVRAERLKTARYGTQE